MLLVIPQGNQRETTSQIDITTTVTMVTTGADESETGKAESKGQLNNILKVTISLFSIMLHLNNVFL